MGKTGKRVNWKARQTSHEIKKDNDLNEKPKISINVDIDVDHSKYDLCNQLVLTANSSQTKSQINSLHKKQNLKTKVLSKKQRKKLEKVLERKKRKINRSKLLNDLQEFRAEDKEYLLMSSTSDAQTCGRKRIDYLKFNPICEEIIEKNSIKYRRRKKMKNCETETVVNKDLNIVDMNDNQLSDSESDESISSESDLKRKQKLSFDVNLNVPQIEKNILESVLNDSKDEIKCENKSNDKTNEEKIETSNKLESIARIFVNIDRRPEIVKSRSLLPIVTEEHIIMDAVFYNPVIIICGETGSGKTTQVPQFLYESGFAKESQMICVTEPRRMAAIAMSKRIADEMNVSTDEVSYQIRFDTNVTQKTKIKFMTDGVLLKEIQNDFLLTKYSIVVIDEAHERSLHSDILIGLLSRIVPLRNKKQNPLKLIIMSATLRVEDFTTNSRLFKTVPPVIKIDSRQFPVSVHFNKKTNSDYLDEAFKKVCKIHLESPSGGVLVFVTGRQEVEVLCKKLRIRFPHNSSEYIKRNKNIQKKNINKHNVNENKNNSRNRLTSETMPAINLDDYEINPLEKERVSDDFDYSDNENDIEVDDSDEDNEGFNKLSQPLHCLPLYSMLPHAKQVMIFKDPPQGSRMCIISTNVAETSLTIPNIRYVVDTGKIKSKVYDNVTGISTFIINWTSKASADQRAGRAGRTGPGHCYRLFSSSIFNDEFVQYSEPEIILKPVDDLILQMKSMNIENVVNFPFPSQPSKEALLASEKRLISMGALKPIAHKSNRKSSDEWKAKITPLGKAMSSFPISPRYAKMLALSRQHQLMPYTIAIVSALTIQELFINDKESNQKRRKQNIWSGNINSLLLGDVMVMLNTIGAAQFAGINKKFCEQNGLRFNAMIEINKLRSQLTSQMNQIGSDSFAGIELSLEMNPPNDLQIKLLRQIVLSGFFDHIAKKISVLEIEDKNNEKRKIRNSYQSIEIESPVFISPDSVLSDELPEYVVYQEIFESSRMNMRNVVAIEPEWLPTYVPNLCTFSNPSDNPLPRYDSSSDSIKCFRSSTFGPHAWPITQIELEYPSGLEKYKLFAKFLLEGEIVPFFKSYSKFLLSPPSIITKSWASLQPRTEKILKALISQNIDTKRDLINKWKSDQNYLLKEYKDWLPDTYHSKVNSLWPPELSNH